MNELVEYELHGAKTAPKLSGGKLYRYVFGANGIFVYSKNAVFEAMIPIQPIKKEPNYIRGLEVLTPMFRIAEKVPFYILRRMIDECRAVSPSEALFFLKHEDKDSSRKQWNLYIPRQQRSHVSVKSDQDWNYVPVEVHSHNTMDAFFSATDNADETGLRIYAVLGHVDRQVVDIKVRISIYGHRAIVPYAWVFENYYEVCDVKA